MNERRYATVDVFTTRMFGGNPLAVVLDARGLTTSQMEAIAAEFNYAETTFVLPPRDPTNSAHVRIFTPRSEVPFAGHPNVGTAIVLARELVERGEPLPERFVFEEAAGLVPVRLLLEQGAVVAAELKAPEPLSVGASVSVGDAAECLTLTTRDIRVDGHPPQVISVGLPFLVVELATRTLLAQAAPNLAAHARVLPPIKTDAIFAYVRGDSPRRLSARMFAPLDGIVEDPATGSATAAAIALLASLEPRADGDASWVIEQGVDMGRPSLLYGRTEKRGRSVVGSFVAGPAVPVTRGYIAVP